jgi:putative ABC transport system permease protein
MSWIAGAAQRVRELFRPSRVEADLEEELHDHLARERERQQHAGVSDIDAPRRAVLRAGRIDLAMEAVADDRTGRLMNDLIRDVRVALRGIRRNPGFTATVVLSLALGIGGTTAIFSVVYAVLVRPLPYPHSDQLHLVRVWWNDFSSSLSPADFLALSEGRETTRSVGAFYFPNGGFALATPDGPEVVEGGFVSINLPHVFGVAPIVGPGFSATPDAREALVSEGLWRERFGGSADAIGRSITLDGEAFAIVGVMPAGFNLTGQRDGSVWVRAQFSPPKRRGPFFLTTIARLPAGTSAAAAEARLTAMVTPILRDRYGVADKWRYGVRSLKDVVVGDTRQTLLLTLGAVVLVLAIAIANVTNLLLARGTVRARELAVRASLGAGRGRLARQLLVEAAMLGLMGGVLGLVLAVAAMDIARLTATDIVPRMEEVRLDTTIALFSLALGIVAGLIAGVVPVLRLPWARLGDWLRDGGRTVGEGLHHGRLRQALVVAEVALALTVLSAAALLVKSLVRVQHVDPGFRSDNLLSFRLALPDQPYENADRTRTLLVDLDARLHALPGVTAVAYAMSLPPDLLEISNNYTLEGAAPGAAGASGVADWNVISADFFTTMGIRVTRGRRFEETDREGAPLVTIVNESFVRRHYPHGGAIGQRLKGGEWDAAGPWTTIVGVAADVPYSGVWGGASPTVYTAYAQNLWLQSPYVIIKAAEPSGLVQDVRRIVGALDSRVPLRNVATMNERLRLSTATPRFRGLLFSSLGGLALMLAVTGLYGVMAYHVRQKRRETAIRRALGARTGQVVRSTLGAGLRLALAGIVLGTGGALAASRSLSALLYHVDPGDPGVLIGMATLLVAAAALACAVPALRAAQIDPATILRDE